jgi:hypothetical protein
MSGAFEWLQNLSETFGAPRGCAVPTASIEPQTRGFSPRSGAEIGENPAIFAERFRLDTAGRFD